MHVQPSDALPKIMLARYYSASLSRFLSADPVSTTGKNLRNPQRWNRYTYSANNPVKFFDPDGQEYVNATGRRLRDQVINQKDPSPTGTATVKALDAEPEKVKVKVSSKAAIGLVDASGNLVPGTLKEVKPSKVGQAAGDLQKQAEPGQTVAPVGGQYEVKATDSQGNVTKSEITIYQGSQNVSVEGQAQSTEEFKSANFVHESEHGVGSGVTPEPQAEQTEQQYIKESKDGK